MRKIFVTKPLAEALNEYYEKYGESAICADGKEYPSDKKLFVHSDNRPISMKEQLQRLLRDAFDRQMDAQNIETSAEANDFDVNDDVEELKSPYEINDMVEEFLNNPPPSLEDKVSNVEPSSMTAEPEPGDPGETEPD